MQILPQLIKCLEIGMDDTKGLLNVKRFFSLFMTVSFCRCYHKFKTSLKGRFLIKAWKKGYIDLIFTTNMLQSVFFVEMASSVVINHFFMRSGKKYCKNKAIVLIHQKNSYFLSNVFHAIWWNWSRKELMTQNFLLLYLSKVEFCFQKWHWCQQKSKGSHKNY